MAVTAQAAASRWQRCPRPESLPARPRFERVPDAVYAHGGRLLRLHFGERAIVAKRFAGPDIARTLLSISAHLAERCAHVPAASLVEGDDGGSWWLCSDYLEGEPWLEQRGLEEHVAEALLALHAAMRSLPAEWVRVASRTRQARTLAWLRANIDSEELSALAAAGSMTPEQLGAALEAYLRLRSQAIHHDLHEGNVWWSGGKVWFLDLEEVPSSVLPVSADLMRYVERHLLLPSATVRASAPRMRDFWRSYHRAAGAPAPDRGEAFCAAAWNWVDSWAALHTLDPRPRDYASERRKFLRILHFYVANWNDVASELDAA